jgi:hypothetical protein
VNVAPSAGHHRAGCQRAGIGHLAKPAHTLFHVFFHLNFFLVFK